MNNVLNRATSYLKGEGSRPLLQNLVDYGSAGLVGAAGQQVMNMVSPGADPNALISGVIASPLITLGGRFLRGSANPASRVRDARAVAQTLTDPYTNSAVLGSAAGALGGGATSLYNTIAGGNDIDNNMTASILATAAPLTASLLSRRQRD